MKKLLLLITLILALLVTVVACDTAKEPEDTTATSTEAPTEEATEATTEAPTEEATEETTEAPTEEATEEVTEAPTEETTEETTEAPTEETTEEVTEPEAPKTYEVDLNSAPISGSWTAPMDGTNVGFPGAPIVALHYGSLNLGEMDLSQYSKVTITYTTPAGELNGSNFDTEYEATGKRVLLLNSPSAVQEGTPFEYLPAEDAIITSAHYEKAPITGETMTVEIDLTSIDYNGQLYLTFDARNSENGLGAIGYLVYVASIVFA